MLSVSLPRQPGTTGSPREDRRPGRAVSAGSQLRRGEIRLTDLAPTRGSETDKRRPAVTVSNDRANATAARLARGVLTVVPVTSNVTVVFPFQVLLPAGLTRLRADFKAPAEQLRSGPTTGRWTTPR